jgi:hypothetical protein
MTMAEPAPVALFAFNRPEHTLATLDALHRNDLAAETEITIFCDGARTQEDNESVAAVRHIAHQARGFKRVVVVERDTNFGLARSVITGVGTVLKNNDTVIVVEDDLVTSPFFLAYMNDGLERYADIQRVISICGYTYPTEKTLPETFFLPGAHCWGWATWRRGWNLFKHDPQQCLDELRRRDLIYEFDVEGTAPYTLFMQRAAAGEADSWALRWMASAILNDKLSLYPGTSLVQNIGNEGSGTNARKQDAFRTRIAERQPEIDIDEPKVDASALADYRLFLLRGYWQGGLAYRIYYKILKMLPKRFERRLYTAVTCRLLRRFEHT